MHRESFIGVLGLLLCASSASIAQRGSTIQFHGTPASVTSPSVDGRFRGIPASVTDPTFRNSPNSFGHQHGNFAGHHHRGTAVVAVPYYVPYYGYGLPYYDYSAYEQSQPLQVQPQQTPPPQVIVIKEESSDPITESDDSRYGEHSFEDVEPSREGNHDRAAQTPPPPQAVASTQDEDPPMTTLIYRDGHKSEVRNYAIVGTNLIDLTKSPVMKKIPLASLDLEATRRENEENGVDFHLP